MGLVLFIQPKLYVLSGSSLGVSWSLESLSGHESHGLPYLKYTLQSSPVPSSFRLTLLL